MWTENKTEIIIFTANIYNSFYTIHLESKLFIKNIIEVIQNSLLLCPSVFLELQDSSNCN